MGNNNDSLNRRGDAKTDILIVGGGVGGCAAAMAATSLGKRVIITEETDWLGGQLTSQAVPPDEHSWIEQFGRTQRYADYRRLVRKYYRDNYPLTHNARRNRFLNPGNGFVSRLCHEFRVGVAVIDQMLASARSTGLLETRFKRKALSAYNPALVTLRVKLLSVTTSVGSPEMLPFCDRVSPAGRSPLSFDQT